MPARSFALFGLIAGTLFLASCSGGGPAPAAPGDQVEKLLGKRAVEILTKAKEVETFRIDPKAARDKKDDKGKEIHGYPVLAEGKKQGEAYVKRVRDVLFSEKTYLFELAKGCEFLPGVVLRFRDGKEHLDVLLCFSCDELQALTVDAGGKVAHKGHEDFDPVRKSLVELAKEAFPDDPVIQGLRVKGE